MVKFLRWRLWCVLLGVFLAADIGCGEENTQAFGISWSQVHVPEGYIVLVKNTSDVGAIKFITSTNNNIRFLFYEKESSAEYEWCSFDKRKTVADRGRKCLAESGLRFIAKLSFSLGEEHVDFKSFKFRWNYPSVVWFGTTARDSGIKFAPTAWTQFEQVDLNDKRLKWFEYDVLRTNNLVLSLDRLPGGSGSL
ncbi:MAG: hypothetical protein HOO88_07735 [Kiritimatiellaceae bacterium]|nr:hypothetical protein [Kiritimatiellaceae bacterium]